MTLLNLNVIIPVVVVCIVAFPLSTLEADGAEGRVSFWRVSGLKHVISTSLPDGGIEQGAGGMLTGVVCLLNL